LKHQNFHILVLNPGSTSTKIAVYRDETEIFCKTISHSREELKPFVRIADQYAMRLALIESAVNESGMHGGQFDAVVGRGGLLRPIPGGTYRVDETMLETLRRAENGEHASNLGAILAHEIAVKSGKPAFIVDPVVVDEMDAVARVTGLPEISRRSIFHALNQKAVALRACRNLGLNYAKARLIVVHLGGGISVGCHREGRVVDVNNALNGEGPFSPERAGSLPAGQLTDLCYSGRYSKEEIYRKLAGNGGISAHLGTHDFREVRRRIENGDQGALLIYRAMIYQIRKAIGAMAAALEGETDAIVLTGGLAYDSDLIAELQKGVSWIALVHVYPGEEEMLALAQGALRVLSGDETARKYDAS